MTSVQYGVIILNYNCADDAILAAKSVIENAKSNDFVICIVDGGSNTIEDAIILQKLSLQNTFVLFLNENLGYAYGNNQGYKYLKSKYDFEYTVIMNPDVIITEYNTIEDTIDVIGKRKLDIIGGQPLVQTGITNIPASEQINIRNVCWKKDCLILSCFIFNRIMNKRYREYIYEDQMPFNNEVEYYTPSGAFFIIRSSFFEEIGLFDERTFLYSEELIVGFKTYNSGKKFLLIPDHIVQHECGKSIGANAKMPSVFSHRESKRSFDIYMKYYLKVNYFFRVMIHLFQDINFICKKLFWKYL